MIKDCGTCRHEWTQCYKQPCITCLRATSRTGWRPKEEGASTTDVLRELETAFCGLTSKLEDIERGSSLKDPINPAHYKNTYAAEVIELIKSALTEDEYRGYLKGNMLKYRLRAGYKDDRNQDLDKSNWYQDALKEVSNA